MKLLDTNRYYLPGTKAVHLASIEDGFQEYVCFFFEGKLFIERITGGHLEFIESDQKAEELQKFLEDCGVLDIRKPALPDNEWLTKKIK